MKILFKVLMFVVSLLTVNVNYGQQSTNMVDVSNKWYEYGGYGGYYPYPLQLVHQTYYYNGDTLITGITYNKLYCDHRDTTYSTPIYLQNFNTYWAAIRQDSLKVYFILKNDSTEKLYCDFENHVGDTLKYYYNIDHLIVNSIDSIPFGSTFRKKYLLNNGYNFYDGIGSGFGLFQNYHIGIEGGVYLVCFQQQNISQYVYQLGGTPPNCGLTTTSINETYFSNEIQIFPNPYSNSSTIKFNYDPENKYTLQIIDINGRIVQAITDIFSDKIQIERKDLTEGLYFYQLTSDNGVIKSGKLIIK